MKRTLLKRGFARTMMCLIVALSFLLGGGRSLNAVKQDAFYLYYNGAYGGGQGIPSDMNDLIRHSLNLTREAEKHMDENAPEIDAVGNAIIYGLDVLNRERYAEGLDGMGAAAEALFEADTALVNAPAFAALEGEDSRYRDNLYDEIVAARRRLTLNPYDEAARAYNDALNAFPGVIYAKALFLRPLETLY